MSEQNKPSDLIAFSEFIKTLEVITEQAMTGFKLKAEAAAKPAPDIATQASQQEQAGPPKEEPKQDPHYDGRDLFNKVFEQALEEDAVRRLDEAARASQEQATPACHPQLLQAFGLLMRRVGVPPAESAPGPVQKAVMRLAEVLAEGSEVSVENFFDRAHMADIEARRNRLEAKIARDSKPRRPVK